MSGALYAVTLATSIGCGLAAGVFFAFSSFVMPALGRLPAPQGIAAMQSINRAAVTPVFMTQLFGTALACLALAVWVLASPDKAPEGLVLGGCAAYLVGNITVTMFANVPRNNELEATDPESAAGEEVWRRYLARWTAWNTVRATTAVVATGLLVASL
jgi:uncharacterized membrane protein